MLLANTRSVTAATAQCRHICTAAAVCGTPSSVFIFNSSIFILLFPSPCSQALVQALGQESTDLFSELSKSVSVTGTQVGELLGNHETSLGSQVEGQVHRLEQEVAQLRWRSEELSRLADMQDHICFLKVSKVQQDCCWDSLKSLRTNGA